MAFLPVGHIICVLGIGIVNLTPPKHCIEIKQSEGKRERKRREKKEKRPVNAQILKHNSLRPFTSAGSFCLSHAKYPVEGLSD